MTEFSSSLLSTVASECKDILGIECDAQHMRIGGKYADITLCVAFAYDRDANDLADVLRLSIPHSRLCRVLVADSIQAADKSYINMSFQDPFLESLAEEVMSTLPLPDVIGGNDTDYALARAYMISTKNNDFATWISKPLWRRAFLLAISGTPIAFDVFLNAQKREISYDGAGKLAGAICRLLYKEQRRIKI